MSYSCGNCGAEFEKGTKFCPNCGTKINWKKTNDNQDESSDRYKLYGLLFVAICACISMGIFIYLGDWFLAIFLTICCIIIVGGFITYAEENDIPKNITLLLTCCIGIVYLAMAINSLDNYWDLQKEIEQRAQETEQMEKEQKKEEAERKEREKKEEAEREEREKQDKIKRVADMAYQKGYQCRRETWGDYNPSSESRARLEYTMRYGREPEEEGQSERWNVFKENYMKGFSDAAEEIKKKMREEEF